MRLGPWEPRNTLLATKLAVTYSRKIPEQIHSEIAQFLEHGFQQHDKKLLLYLQKSKKLPRACALLENKNLEKKYCSSLQLSNI